MGQTRTGKTQEQVVEELRRFQAEVVKVAGPVHRRDIHQDQLLVAGLEKLGKLAVCASRFGLVGSRVLSPKPSAPVDDTADQKRAVVGRDVDRDITGQRLDFLLELIVELSWLTSGAVSITFSISVCGSEKSGSRYSRLKASTTT